MNNDFIKLNFLDSFIKSNSKYRLVLSGLLSPIDLFLIKSIVSQNKKILYITPDEQSALRAQKDLKTLLEINSEVLVSQEVGFYSELEKNYYIYQEQINIFLEKPSVVFAPVKSLLEKYANIDFYKKNIIEFKKNDEIDYQKISQKLVELGYKRTTNVTDIGEFALRGDILDIYGLDYNPIRIEFFAETIEDIRYFNPNTQKSFKKVESARILPLYKFILNDENRKNFINKIKSIENKDDFSIQIKNELIEKIETIGYFEGIEYYLNNFLNATSSVLDFFEDYILIFKESGQIFSKYQNLDEKYIQEYTDSLNSNLKLPLETLNHTSYNDFQKQIKKFKNIGIDNFLEDDYDKIIEFDLSIPPIFSCDITKIDKFLKEYLNKNYKILVCTNFPNRLKEIFDELEIFSDDIFYFPDISTGGVICDDEKISKEKFIILSDKELFNRHNRDITTKKHYSNKQTQDFIDSINDIKIGEYVVHSIHGIGIYNGITKQTIDENQKDYLEIQFQGTDKLFMPAEQINLLCRYRGTGANKPKLSKMGGSAWETTKSKAKKEVESIAYDLLDLYAKRKMASGIEFEADSNWQYEMEENFEYTETPDQMKAIIETKKDMEDIKPMDRLICADVGFGKTEIALRAMFKAVMSGYQSALIAPTTILTMQHFETIKERFEPFDVNVAVLNRFCSKKEQKQVIQEINEGKVDVVIATHRLLSDDIKFKKLGLLVIDEEHKFGVRHKEKLKKFKENIDVLSLSATPIPRTLNMALSGLKDLSVINTPPKNRLPIKTYVGEFSETYVKNAINQELQRDGQVYYLYNRVETINKFKEKLRQIIPNARIAIAHGQMAERELETVICDFSSKKYDVLLSTTIIESGLDIPNANTMIIHNADNFGLAQLYQLRGRVGRCDRQAYCFCFYKRNKELNEQARKRLESIKDFSSLGSGYQIALRDIEIRGVGNILGTHQHGQMVNVGFDTYCNLLKECIDDIKQKQNKNPYEQNMVSKKEPAIVDINADAYIPDEWAQTYEQKILEYKRLSDVSTISELENMEISLKDRFSKIPVCVENLIKLIKLRILATNANISAIRQAGNQIRINTPFTAQEWIILKSKIEPKYTKYFTYSTPPKNLNKVKGILLMNKNEDDFDEIFNKLSDLFYHISEVILNFKVNQ
ncbi:MAG: transcription-repair coupling factor [Candidatus Gastranaerophilales bacterium]|nr:transcription-repair coupling factor [Candidatus Gastranaerophilales bacterium]